MRDSDSRRDVRPFDILGRGRSDTNRRPFPLLFPVESQVSGAGFDRIAKISDGEKLPSGLRTLEEEGATDWHRIHGISIRSFPSLVNFVPAVAYIICLNMPVSFSQPENGLIEIPCIMEIGNE